MKRFFNRFFQSESSSGWLLLTCIAGAIIIANSPASIYYTQLLQTNIGGNFGAVNLDYSLQEWINDGLMAVFFLLVGLEVKRAFLIGDLSSFEKASLPVFAAIGGCIVPAICYFAINTGLPTSHGWAIPMATDIAFALAVLKLAGGNKSGSAISFLSTLAIADDICAIIVIAIFYSGNLHPVYLLLASAVFLLQLICNKAGVKSLWFYMTTGLLLWYLVHHSGIHATIAGVLTAFAVPLNGPRYSPLERLEHALLSPVNLIIVPIFVLANTNVTFSSTMISGLLSPMAIGIYAGLLIGKPVGIMLVSFISIKLGISSLPDSLSWRRLLGLGILGGIGFTMSIFVALLSFDDQLFQEQAKLAILIASTTAGMVGYFVYHNTNKRVL